MTSPVDSVVFRNALLLIAIAGVLLLFAREWSVRLAGLFLMLPRLLFEPLLPEEWLLLGSGTAAALGRLVYQWRRPGPADAGPRVRTPDTPEPDEVSEAAPCPACGGTIPAGAIRCSACGWSYVSQQG